MRLKNSEDFVNKLVVSRDHFGSHFEEGEVVLVKFESRQKLSSLEFSEYLVYKQTKN